jgi:hypothetical protein
MYRVYWVEANEVKKSLLKSPKAAFKYMESLLASGIPSWMVSVPWQDDDVPF